MRLIDADELFTTPYPRSRGNGKPLTSMCAYITDQITHAPTIDAVPVVRCKDCKHGKTWKNAFGIGGFKCDLLCVDLSPEAFCSYGERRSDE